jgi:alcohol dehydrogenase class IV
MTDLGSAFSYHLPTRIKYAPGIADELGRFCVESGFASAFVVVDPGLLDAGRAEAALSSLESSGVLPSLAKWPGGAAGPNPRSTFVEDATDFVQALVRA